MMIIVAVFVGMMMLVLVGMTIGAMMVRVFIGVAVVAMMMGMLTRMTVSAVVVHMRISMAIVAMMMGVIVDVLGLFPKGVHSTSCNGQGTE